MGGSVLDEVTFGLMDVEGDRRVRLGVTVGMGVVVFVTVGVAMSVEEGVGTGVKLREWDAESTFVRDAVRVGVGVGGSVADNVGRRVRVRVVLSVRLTEAEIVCRWLTVCIVTDVVLLGTRVLSVGEMVCGRERVLVGLSVRVRCVSERLRVGMIVAVAYDRDGADRDKETDRVLVPCCDSVCE